METRHRNLVLAASFLFTGCQSISLTPTEPKTEGVSSSQEQFAQARDAQRALSYLNKLNPVPRAEKNSASVAKLPPVRLTVQAAISRFVPKEYKVAVSPEVNQQTLVTCDPSAPWMESLGKCLASVSLEMNANLYKRSMIVKAFESSLAEVIEKHVPSEYKVFTDAEVNVDSLLRYDERQHWADALGQTGSDSGLDINANLTRKVIVIKPLTSTNKDQIQKP